MNSLLQRLVRGGAGGCRMTRRRAEHRIGRLTVTGVHDAGRDTGSGGCAWRGALLWTGLRSGLQNVTAEHDTGQDSESDGRE